MMPEPRPRRTAPSPEVPQGTREALATWMSQKFEEIERAHQERIELIRNGGEHPMPVFQQQARNYGVLGMPKSLAAKMIGISVATFMNHYADDYDIGAAELISMVSANMVRIATSTTDPNNAKVGMQLLERRGGEEFRPPSQKIEVDNSRDKTPLIDSSKLTFEERRLLQNMLERVAAGGDAEPESEPETPKEDEPVIG